MREEVRESVSQVMARRPPRDQEFYDRQGEAVDALVAALRRETGRGVLLERPQEMLNFYDLQFSLDSTLRTEPRLQGKSGKAARRREREGRQLTRVLHLLASRYSPWVCPCWERPGGWIQEIQREGAPEEQTLAQVRRVAEEQRWRWLTPAEGAEVVPDAEPFYPYEGQPILVRHLLFAGYE